ncbi:MAG: hypothetical protein U0974_10995 [Gemmatimonadales bacterium]|nr:hypothetical protein [Gemmatimonadales bacterium]MDZ4390239.1 hypothetical protein [Gemmatimonadales bacterium]
MPSRCRNPAVRGALATALFPARTELLDASGDRLAVLRELPSGEVAVEVRTLKRVD